MELVAIPLSLARAVARSGDLARIRDMGRKHLDRHAPWEEKSMARIVQVHGMAGLLAAMDADHAHQAAARIASLPPSSWYLSQKGFSFWARPGMEAVFQALLELPGGIVARTQLRPREIWDAVMMQREVSQDTACNAARLLGVKELNCRALAWPASYHNDQAWKAWIKALGPAYFLAPIDSSTLPRHGKIAVSPLYHLTCHAKLLARGRLVRFFEQLEQDPAIRPQLAAAAPALAWAAVQSGRKTLLRKILGWTPTPIVMPGGMDLIEVALLGANISTSTWAKRWACLKLLGAGKPQVLDRYLRAPRTLEALLRVASGGDAIHVVEVMTTAAEAGVDLSTLRDKEGRRIPDAIRARQTEYSDGVAALIQQMELDKQTTQPRQQRRGMRL